MDHPTANLDLIQDLITKARKAGADAADAVFLESTSLDASWRMGKNEGVERAESSDLGLRVLIGHKQAIVSSTDTNTDALAELVDRAVAMARTVPDDPYCGLADPALLAKDLPDLDLFDPTMIESAQLLDAAAEAEDAARAVDGITNSEGSEASWSLTTLALANSDGFAGRYRTSTCMVVASVVAGADTHMERDYDYAVARYIADLESPASIGAKAAERAVRRLNPRKVKSCQVPVVFDPRVSGGFLRLLAMTISGAAIARGTSFLKDRLGDQIFDQSINIIDDPLKPRGLSSRPFDGEGVAGRVRPVIENGCLTTWLMDARSARQLDLTTTGHAARSVSAPPSPSPSNLYMAAGPMSPGTMIGEIDQGFYVTEMMGMSFNNITGDYSRGAAGFWIDQGELAYPVSEVTVAGNLKDMFPNATPANDLEFRYGMNAPTLRIDGMTIAGL